MDVQILDLDKAYLTSEELSQYIKENAQKISNDLRITIGNIKIHWKGEDATNHINAWINNYDKVSHHFQELYVISRYLQNYFVIIQTGRNRISEKKGIGTPNTDIYEFNPIQKIDGTSEYYYDEQLKTDHIALQETYNQYNTFVNKVEENMGKILSNWKKGKIGRDQLISKYQNSFMESQTILKEYKELMEDLGKALQNIDRISKE